MGQFDRHGVSVAGEPSAVHRDKDFYAWLVEQAALLRSGNHTALDSMNVAEELEEMAAEQCGKVVSLLRVILVHLLKWQYSRVRRSENSWRTSLVWARTDLVDLLGDSRTLHNEMATLLAKAYRGARSVAGIEMRLTRREWQSLFPETCPWTEFEVLDEDFLPAISSNADGRS